MKLQKYMSQSGVCSRRKAEEWIAEGLVKVNDETAHTGQVVDPDTDKIEYDGQLLQKQQDFVYYKLNKPRGIVTTCKSDGEKGILDIIDIKERVFPIGRLDKNTTGLILLTNDGRLSHKLMHPSFEHEKQYIVHTYGKLSDEQLETMGAGMRLIGKEVFPCTVERLGSSSFSIILKQGINRQIRRMVERIGEEVKRLKRVRIQNIHLDPDMPIGSWEPLSPAERKLLLKSVDISLL